MKKFKSVVASILALSCINLVACDNGDKVSYTVTLQVGSEVYETISVDKDSQLETPKAPTKEGYTFVGWYVDEALTQKYEPSVLTANTTLYAKFEAKQLRISLDLDGGSLDEGVNKYVLVKHNETYALPTPSKTNYTFVGWVMEKDDGTTEAFPASGTYAMTSGCFLTALWEKASEDADEESTALFVKVGDYFKERETVDDEFTYVFVTGKTYNFNTLKELGIVGAGSAVEQNGLSFKAVGAVEEFTLKITKEVDGTEIEYDRTAKIVDQVESFDGGADYLASWGATVDRTANFYDASKTVAETKMSIGRSNFIPDMLMYNDKDEALTWDEANVVVTVTDDGVATEDYTFEDGVFNFGDSIVAGSVVEVTYAPKYSLNNQSMTVKMTLNDGVNVYDNAQLRAAYGNGEVSEINVLRNIKAEVAPEDWVVGYEGQYPINQRERAIYARITESREDVIKINGNFFKVDGSKLPYVNNDYCGWNWGTANAEYYVPNSQIGMFLYLNTTNIAAGDRKQLIHNGQVTINDLYITGNYTKDAGYTVNYGDRKLLEQGGSYSGIWLRGGRLTLNNTTIMNTNCSIGVGSSVDALEPDTHCSQVTLNNSKLKHAYGSSLYTYYLVSVDINGSFLGDNNGPAIHLDEVPTNLTATMSKLSIDENTLIDNYIHGEETFFVARKMEVVAGQLKTAIEGMVSQQTGGQLTVLREGADGLQYVNFVVFMASDGSHDTASWMQDSQGYPEFEKEGFDQARGYIYFHNQALGVQDPAQFMAGYVTARPVNG